MDERVILSIYLEELVTNNIYGNDIAAYRRKCAAKFKQCFDNESWHRWFEKEIYRFVWRNPSDAPARELAKVSKYLQELLAKHLYGADAIASAVYREQCASRFAQFFDTVHMEKL